MTRLFIPIFFSPNNTYDVRFNGESVNSGHLLEDFKPPVNPEKEIDDPEDKKPEDWVDAQKIADPEAKKVSKSFIGRGSGNVSIMGSLMTGPQALQSQR